jgi:pimeloyl-ACP methyl ester carboxylesterase
MGKARGISAVELEAVKHANSTGKHLIVFMHGLWLLPNSWDRWAALFEDAGFAALTLDWPEVADARALMEEQPRVLADRGIAQVADHFAKVVNALGRRPAVVGHSFGGLLAQILAGRGLSAATVAINPAPFRGVLPLPYSELRPALQNPSGRGCAVPLTFEQFRHAVANAVSEDEAEALYNEFAVPASGAPTFDAAYANVDPWTDVKIDTANPDRGPLLIISGEKDRTAPWGIAKASFDQQEANPCATEILEIKNRGHSLTIDAGWREVAATALGFIRRFV